MKSLPTSLWILVLMLVLNGTGLSGFSGEVESRMERKPQHLVPFGFVSGSRDTKTSLNPVPFMLVLVIGVSSGFAGIETPDNPRERTMTDDWNDFISTIIVGCLGVIGAAVIVWLSFWALRKSREHRAS